MAIIAGNTKPAEVSAPAVPVPAPVKLVHVFKNKLASCQYVFASGKVAPFVNHSYHTDIQSEIDEFHNEIAQKHPHIYVEAGKETMDTTKVDPLEFVRAKAVQDYIDAQALANDKSNDRGTSEQGKLNVATTTSIAVGASGSTATASK